MRFFYKLLVAIIMVVASVLILLFGISITVMADGPGSVPLVKHVVADNSDYVSDVYAIDLDNDGDVDLLSTNWLYDDLIWWENDGNENFLQHKIADNVGGIYSVYAAKINNDDDIDILGTSQDADDVIWWENDGNKGFTVTHTVDGFFDGAYDVYAADLDDDNDLDVLGAARTADDITWWENDGTGTFSATHTIDGDFDGATSVYATDLDSDGDIDVLGAALYADDITWWENDGSGAFSAPQTIDGDFNGATSVYATDLDSDDDIDVLGTAFYADDITWWENDGEENFSKHTIDSFFEEPRSVYATDLDSDGDIDVLGAAFDADDITWWENDGSETFTKRTIDGNFDGANAVYATDIDQDGDVDVLGAAMYDDVDGNIVWWEQIPAPSISIADTTINENYLDPVTASFDVSLSFTIPLTVTVDYATSNGSATAPSDFTEITPTTLTFAPNQQTNSVTVTIQNDRVYEPDETFLINLTDPNNAKLGDSQATGTIINDATSEQIAGLTASNDSPTYLGTATVLTASVTSGNNITYTWSFGDGEMGYGPVVTHTYPAIASYTAIVTASNDQNSLSTNTDVEIEEAPLCQQYDFGTSGVGFSVYIWGQSWDFTAPFNMDVDSIEAFSWLSSSNLSQFTIGVKVNDEIVASWSGLNIVNLYGLSKTAQVSIDVEKGDKITYYVTAVSPYGGTGYIWGPNYVKLCSSPNKISIGDASVTEGDSGTTPAVFTVTISPVSTQTVTVDYLTVNDSATAPTDYTAISTTTLTFAPNETTKHISVDIHGDKHIETDETFWVYLSNPVNADLSDANGQGIITNDDAPNQPPGTPSSPAPDNGASDVPTHQVLRWQGGDPDGDVVTYTVAFGTVNPPLVVATTNQTNYTPSLVTNTTCYWVITATDGMSTSVGATWSFTTSTTVSSDNKVYLPIVLKE